MTFEEWWESKHAPHTKDTDPELVEIMKNFSRVAWDAARPKWEPIETAPKNEVMFLGYVPHSSGGYICCFYWNEKLKQWQNNIDGGCDMPTHWMPLPVPPKGARSETL